MSVRVGERAPEVTLADESRADVALPLEGRPNVLVFYRGDW